MTHPISFAKIFVSTAILYRFSYKRFVLNYDHTGVLAIFLQVPSITCFILYKYFLNFFECLMSAEVPCCILTLAVDTAAIKFKNKEEITNYKTTHILFNSLFHFSKENRSFFHFNLALLLSYKYYKF